MWAPGGVSQAARKVFRSVRLVGLLLTGIGLAFAVRIEGGRRLPPEPLTTWWSRRLMRVLGIEMTVVGQPPASGHLLVANHVSWLDINVMGACASTRFISKAEVRRWPVAGTLAIGCGTFFLRRGKGGSKPLLEKLVPHLRAGGSVTLYPEGTTTAGEDVLPFHARLFAGAIESGLPVQPVALSYGRGDGGERLAPFVGDDTLVAHVVRLLGNRRMTVRVEFCEPVASKGRSREELATLSRDRIRAALVPPPPEFGDGRAVGAEGHLLAA